MTSEERIDELEKRVRIMELKNDNLGKSNYRLLIIR